MEVVDGWTDGMRWDGLDEKRLAAGRGQARSVGSSLSLSLSLQACIDVAEVARRREGADERWRMISGARPAAVVWVENTGLLSQPDELQGQRTSV